MDIKLEGFYTENSEFYQHTLDLRSKMFVDEFGFNKHLEFDGLDDKATHYLLLMDGIAAGCARWIEHKESIRVDRFGVLKDYRGKGFGLLLIKFIKAELKGSKKTIELLTTDDSILFFIQQGFKDSGKFETFDKKRLRILSL